MWNEIKSQDDIDKMMYECADFHDSCIVSINYISGRYVDEKGTLHLSPPEKHEVILHINTQSFGAIELKFSAVIKCNIVGWSFGFEDQCILCANAEIIEAPGDKKLFLWSDWFFEFENCGEDNPISFPSRDTTYVLAEKMLWRFVD